MNLYLKKEMLKDTIIFRKANKFKDLTLNGSDISLLQIFQSLQNENDCVPADKTPPRMAMSTAGVINTSSNKVMFENKVKNNRVVKRVSSRVPLGKVENDVRLKGCFYSEVVFKLIHRALSDLEIELLGKGLSCLLLDHLLMKQILIGILLIFREKRDLSGISRMILLKIAFTITLITLHFFTISQLGIQHKIILQPDRSQYFLPFI